MNVSWSTIPVRPEREETGHGAHRQVEPAAAEGRPVRRLVKRAEEKRQDVTVGDHERQDPPRGAEPPQQGARDRERPEVAESSEKRRPIRADHEGVEVVARELVRREPNEGRVDHRSLT